MSAYLDERYCSARVTFRLADTQTSIDGVATATSECVMSQLQQTLNNVDSMSEKLASLEHNYFTLDGKVKLIDSVAGLETGWWSESISDYGGNIDETLTFIFTKDHASIGFTVVFDEKGEECCSDFTISLYDENNIKIAEKKVTGNLLFSCQVPLKVPAYRKAAIHFTKTTMPKRRIRVAEIIFGIVQKFEPGYFTELTLLRELSPGGESLPVSEMSITINNLDHQYNMINADGLYYYLQQAQPLDVEIGTGDSFGNIKYVNCGRYYFKESSAEDQSMTAKIVAQDRLFLLENTIYRKGTDEIDTIENMINSILLETETGLTAIMPESIKNRNIYRRIPVVTCREAIRMVAEAAGCICYVNRKDALEFTNLEVGMETDVLDSNNLSEVPKITVRERINAAEVSITGFAPGNQSEIYKGTADIIGTEEFWITYNSPATSVITTVTRGTLNSAEHYLYAAKLTITANGTVDITSSGTSLSTSESIYKAKNMKVGETEQVTQLKNQLILPEQAKTIAELLLKNAQASFIYKLTGRGNPERDIADSVKIYDAYGENRNAIIRKQQLVFDGALKEDSEAVGGREVNSNG